VQKQDATKEVPKNLTQKQTHAAKEAKVALQNSDWSVKTSANATSAF
jgi:hypothetical protein